MAFTADFTLEPVAPFDFDLSAQIFEGGDGQVRIYEEGVFRQLLKLGGELVLAKVVSIGTVEQPKLKVELSANKPVSAQIAKAAQTQISYIFNLNFPLLDFYRQAANDSTMHKITQQLYGLKNPTTPTVFEALVDSIVEQQISIKVAHTIELRLAKKFGDTLILDGATFYAYPSPHNLAAACIGDIQAVGLSRRKAEYIYGAAKLIADSKLDLEVMKANPDAKAIITELDEIKGIGVWTAELTMLRGMQKLDALPADDFGIRRVISTYYCGGRPIKSAEARQIAEAWGQWKGLAAFYLIIAEVKDIKI